jgi:hypothetical protein
MDTCKKLIAMYNYGPVYTSSNLNQGEVYNIVW